MPSTSPSPPPRGDPPGSVYTPFDRWVASLRHHQAIRHLPAEARVCDLGCGIETLFLASLPAARLRVGVDYQRFESTPGGPHIVRADITQFLPLRDGSFDCVTLLAVIEHLGEPLPALREVHRILAPGGVMIMTWPSAIVDPLLAILCRVQWVSPEMESQQHQPRRSTRYWIEQLMEIGFTNVRHRLFELGLNHILVAERARRPPR